MRGELIDPFSFGGRLGPCDRDFHPLSDYTFESLSYLSINKQLLRMRHCQAAAPKAHEMESWCIKYVCGNPKME